jgi:hypothetical protein
MAALLYILLQFLVLVAFAGGSRAHAASTRNDTLISQTLFWELEQLARIVDIAYCVGTAGLGIQKPFKCLSRCGDVDFESFELVTVRLLKTMRLRIQV